MKSDWRHSSQLNNTLTTIIENNIEQKNNCCLV